MSLYWKGGVEKHLECRSTVSRGHFSTGTHGHLGLFHISSMTLTPLWGCEAGRPSQTGRAAPHDPYPSADADHGDDREHGQRGTAPVLIRVETRAGHGAGTPTSKQIEQVADQWAFLCKELDMHVPE